MMREGFIREDVVRGVVDPCCCYYATRIAQVAFCLLCSSLLEALETFPCPSWPISSLPGFPVIHVYCCIARRQETCMSCPLAYYVLRSNLARSSPLGPLKAFRLMRDVSRTFRPSRCGPSLLHNAYILITALPTKPNPPNTDTLVYQCMFPAVGNPPNPPHPSRQYECTHRNLDLAPLEVHAGFFAFYENSASYSLHPGVLFCACWSVCPPYIRGFSFTKRPGTCQRLCVGC
ncbi:hypothetical protein BKA56DRAFT_581438 [Ilyonectria sp. MPI-CAGE-AT-0026]|nr:hypothetical protein BKA56DRAFT_581438 [Ilyonectria sp. MPI-CAGE-AT-0026]